MTQSTKSFAASMDNNGGRNLIMNNQAIHRYKLMKVKPVIDTKPPTSMVRRRESLSTAAPRRRLNPDPSSLYELPTTRKSVSEKPRSSKRRPKTSRERRKSKRKHSTGSSRRRASAISIKQISDELDSLVHSEQQMHSFHLTAEQQQIFDSFASMLSSFDSDNAEHILRDLWQKTNEQKLLARFGDDDIADDSQHE